MDVWVTPKARHLGSNQPQRFTAVGEELWGIRMTEECWHSVRSELKSSLGRDAFQNWIAPLEYHGVDHRVAVFGAPTTFIGNWVQRNYGAHIHALMSARGADVDRLDFKACSAVAAVGKADPAAPPKVKAAASRSVS